MRGYLAERHGSYHIRVSIKDPDNPKKYKQYTETVKTTSRTIAEKRLREVLTELDKGIFIKPSKLTLGEYLDEWIVDYCWPNLSPGAAEAYAYNVKKYIKPKLGSIPLKTLQPAQVQKLYSELQKQGHKRTALYCHQTLHKALKMALKQGLVARNVTESCEKPKTEDKDATFLDESESLKFLDTAKNSKYYSMAYLFLTAGIRRSELLALKWSDCDLESGRITVTRSLHQLKTGERKGEIYIKEPKSTKSRRSIPLPVSTIQVMKDEYQAQVGIKKSLGMLKAIDPATNISREMTPDEIKSAMKDCLIYCHLEDGSPLRPDSVTHAFTRIARAAGLSEAHLHTLRHSYGSILIKKGVHLKVIQELMGHSSIHVTGDIYSHVAPGLKDKAVEKFDGFLTAGKVLLPA